MNLSLPICFLVIVCLLSCESKLTNYVDVIENIKKSSFDFGATGLSSNTTWPPTYYNFGDNYVIVYNPYRHGLDTLKREKDFFYLMRGIDLEGEGPEAINDFESFFSTDALQVFVSNNAVVTKNDGSNFAYYNIPKMIEPLVSGPFVIGQLTDNLFGRIHSSFDKGNDLLYFFVFDGADNRLLLCKLDLIFGSIDLIPHPVDIHELSKFQILIDDQGTYIANQRLPYIYIIDQELVLSFNYSSDFFVLNNKSGEYQKIINRSEMFPNSKSVKIHLENDPDFLKVLEAMDEISADVEFGAIQKFGSEGGFCRLVRAPVVNQGYSNADFFLEIFDAKFKKLHEIHLNRLAPEMSPFFISYPDGLFIKSKNQSNEEKLDYYFIPLEILRSDDF